MYIHRSLNAIATELPKAQINIYYNLNAVHFFKKRSLKTSFLFTDHNLEIDSFFFFNNDVAFNEAKNSM